MRNDEFFSAIGSISWGPTESLNWDKSKFNIDFDEYCMAIQLKDRSFDDEGMTVEFLTKMRNILKSYDVSSIFIKSIHNDIVMDLHPIKLSIIHSIVLDFIEYLEVEDSHYSRNLCEFYNLKLEEDKELLYLLELHNSENKSDRDKFLEIMAKKYNREVNIRDGIEYDKDNVKIANPMCDYELRGKYITINSCHEYYVDLSAAMLLLQNVTIYCDSLIKKLENEKNAFMVLRNLYTIPCFKGRNISVCLSTFEKVSPVTNKYPVNLLIDGNGRFIIGREYNDSCENDKDAPYYNIIVDESIAH